MGEVPGEECGPPKLSETITSSSSTRCFWAPRTPPPSTLLIPSFWSVCSAEISTQHKPPPQGEGEELASDREASGEGRTVARRNLFPSPTSSPASACPCVTWRADLWPPASDRTVLKDEGSAWSQRAKIRSLPSMRSGADTSQRRWVMERRRSPPGKGRHRAGNTPGTSGPLPQGLRQPPAVPA